MNCLPLVSVRFAVFVSVAMLARVGTFAASMAPSPTFNPATYKSPSGAYALFVDPSDVYGRYGGKYRVTKNGKEIWSATLPFTFCQAAITDSGVVAGYAHTLGQYGFAKDPNEPRPGELIVAIIDAGGKIRLKQVTNRQYTRHLHAPPYPLAHGLIVDEASDWMIVRIYDLASDEIWWTYRLSTGAALQKLTPHLSMPDGGALQWIVDAKLVRGTPLVLLHWLRADFSRVGARFALVDREAKPVWSLELPSDYMTSGDEAAKDKLQAWIADHGGILRSDQPNRFDLFFAAESKRVTFAVTKKTPDEWTVTEIARAPFSMAPSAEPPLAASPKQTLKELDPLPLQANQVGAELPIRNVQEFAVDGQGQIGLLREDEGKTSFVLVDSSGKLLRTVSLTMQPKPGSAQWNPLCWIGGSRFVIAISENAVDGKAKAWSVDAQTGKVEPLPAFDSPAIERLVGTSDGCFVALAALRSKYTIEKSVTRFDRQGRRQWRLQEGDSSKDPAELFSPNDIAVTSEGDVLVLENIANRLKRFDRNGRHLSTIELKKAWQRAPSYVVGVIPESDGRLLISDFGGSPPYVRMTRDGVVAGGFEPKDADGQVIGTAHGMRAAPDGHLWISDGHALQRLSKTGVIDRILGEGLQPTRLGPIAGIVSDPRGRMYAIDSRTGSIHVFDESGNLLHVCQAKPTDFKHEILSPSLTVNDKGDVYLGLGRAGFPDERRSYAHYSANGRRVDDVVMPAGVCQFQPGSGGLVALRYNDVRLVDPAGKVLRTIDRRPDGNWLELPQAVALASDGSMAILAGRTRERGVSANLYKASGEPIHTIPLPEAVGPFPRIAYDRKHLVVAGDNVLLIFDGSGKPIARCDPPLKVPEGMFYYPFLLPGGRELALFDGKRPVLHRYELP